MLQYSPTPEVSSEASFARRWHNHLCPSVNKEEWTEEEDQLIMELVQQMGTKWSKIVKMLPGGVEKHRLIQDLRRNAVNALVRLLERQVLPRFSDHAADLAAASAAGEVETMILDFQHASMTIPAADAEARYNCCLIESPIRRTRPTLDDEEPESGSFLVWRVLGFGGKAYPLLYARVP